MTMEREVRSVKTILRVVLGTQIVPEEVLYTTIVEIEATLNSRPLGYVSSDAGDLDPVTPSHLLMARPDGSKPQAIYPEAELLSRRRWRHSQIMADQFWKRYTRYYLPSLQTRQKWTAERPNLEDGEHVLVLDPQLPRAFWQVGKIVRTLPSKDGRVRVAEVKVDGRTYTRPVTRLIKLPRLPDEAAVLRDNVKKAEENKRCKARTRVRLQE